MKAEYKKLGENTMWMTIGNFSSKLLLFFMLPVYTRVLTTAQYGVCDLMTTIISLMAPLLTVSSTEGILRFALDKNWDRKQLFTLMVAILSGGTIVFTLCTFLLNRFSPLQNYDLWLILYYFFYVFAMGCQTFTKGIGNTRAFAISGIVGTLFTVTLNLLFLPVLHWGEQGYMAAVVGGYVAIILYLACTVRFRKYFVPLRKVDVSLVKSYFNYCLPLVPNQMAWWLNNSSDKFILTYFHGVGVNGIYSVAYKLPSAVNLCATIFYSSWQISAVDDFGTEKSKDFYYTVYKNYHAILAIFTSGVLLFSKLLAEVIFQNEFFIAWKYSAILLLASMLHAMGSFVGTVYTSAMKPKGLFVTTMCAAAVNLVLNFLLIPPFGAAGAAIATVSAYAMTLLLRIIDSRRIMAFRIDWSRHIFNYILLIVQVAIVYSEIHLWYLCAAAIFAVIVAMNWFVIHFVLEIVKKLLHVR